ncbi:MAG: radical SAM protein, partial [Firmicutes bacterium]|nr:radical SAM protein [Bacillota bacterium]MTI71959.1 radical SAM protein [Bacillota bacterium]
MKKARIDMILNTVQRHNILPITSKCNTSCVFCSHKYNPKDVCVYKLPSLNINEIEDMISFLDPNKKIIIGESATRIIEGEPFVRKDIYEILKKIRSYSKEVIEITTNGSNLTLDMVKKLKTLEPLELNVSL